MNISKRFVNAAMLVLAATCAVASASDKKVAESAIAKAQDVLKASALYSEKAPYSDSIPFLYLAYDKDGNVEKGIALRAFKTYEWVTAMIVVEKRGKKYVVSQAYIPDADTIKDKAKRKKVTDAVDVITGSTLIDESDEFKEIDAVTGATRYSKRIYLYFSKMGEAVTGEMKAKPDWEKKSTATLSEGTEKDAPKNKD